jgi:hypothetical protein
MDVTRGGALLSRTKRYCAPAVEVAADKELGGLAMDAELEPAAAALSVDADEAAALPAALACDLGHGAAAAAPSSCTTAAGASDVEAGWMSPADGAVHAAGYAGGGDTLGKVLTNVALAANVSGVAIAAVAPPDGKAQRAANHDEPPLIAHMEGIRGMRQQLRSFRAWVAAELYDFGASLQQLHALAHAQVAPPAGTSQATPRALSGLQHELSRTRQALALAQQRSAALTDVLHGLGLPDVPLVGGYADYLAAAAHAGIPMRAGSRSGSAHGPRRSATPGRPPTSGTPSRRGLRMSPSPQQQPQPQPQWIPVPVPFPVPVAVYARRRPSTQSQSDRSQQGRRTPHRTPRQARQVQDTASLRPRLGRQPAAPAHLSGRRAVPSQPSEAPIVPLADASASGRHVAFSPEVRGAGGHPSRRAAGKRLGLVPLPSQPAASGSAQASAVDHIVCFTGTLSPPSTTALVSGDGTLPAAHAASSRRKLASLAHSPSAPAVSSPPAARSSDRERLAAKADAIVHLARSALLHDGPPVASSNKVSPPRRGGIPLGSFGLSSMTGSQDAAPVLPAGAAHGLASLGSPGPGAKRPLHGMLSSGNLLADEHVRSLIVRAADEHEAAGRHGKPASRRRTSGSKHSKPSSGLASEAATARDTGASGGLGDGGGPAAPAMAQLHFRRQVVGVPRGRVLSPTAAAAAARGRRRSVTGGDGDDRDSGAELGDLLPPVPGATVVTVPVLPDGRPVVDVQIARTLNELMSL